LSFFTGNLRRLGIIIPRLTAEALTLSNWGVFWLLVPLAAIAGYKAFSTLAARVLWILLALHVCLYLFVYIITPWDVELLLSVSRNRLVLHLAPAGMLLIALHGSTLRNWEESEIN
jgi:hypothetical protein